MHGTRQSRSDLVIKATKIEPHRLYSERVTAVQSLKTGYYTPVCDLVKIGELDVIHDSLPDKANFKQFPAKM